MKGRECLWNMKSEHYTNVKAGKNALQEVMHWQNVPELTVQDVKLKIRTIRIWCAAELAKVIQSIQEKKKIVVTHTTFMCRNCCGSNKHTNSCMVNVFHELRCQRLFFF